MNGSDNPYEPPMQSGNAPLSQPVVPSATPLRKRLAVIVPAVAFNAVIAAGLASRSEPALQFDHWLLIMGGPLPGMLHGAIGPEPLGILGALLAVLHPLKPNVTTGIATAAGVFLWIFCGTASLVVLHST